MIKNVGIDIENDIFKQYSYVKRLFIEKKPENCIFEEENGKVHFMGNSQEQLLIWKNLYTDDLVEDNIIYTDRELIYNNNDRVQIGSFILENLNLKDNIVRIDLSVLDKKAMQQLKLLVKLVSDSEINNQKKMILDNGNLRLGGKEFEPISLIYYHSTDSAIYIQDFKKNYLVSQNKNIYLLKKEQQFFIDQTKHNILFSDRIVPYNLDCELLNYMEVSIRLEQLEQQVSAKFDIGEMISMLKRTGYLYLEPFLISELNKNAKILVIANRKIDIEIYEKNKDLWICLQNNKINQVHNELVRLRLCVEAGDIIKKIAIVQ